MANKKQTKQKAKFLRPPFKIHGGKRYLASWIIENFPKNYEENDYIEPYCGAANVFLNKNRSREECINDLNQGVVAIMKAIRDNCDGFIKSLKKIKYEKEVFESCINKINFKSDLELAVNEFILRRMSRGGLKKAFAWSNRERGGMPGDVNAWETIIDQMEDVSKRLKDVYILNKPAISVINAWNNENTLCYCDPPYMPDSRVSKDSYGEEEMDIDQHIELCDLLLKFKGKVIISGYSSTLYKKVFKDWNFKEKK